MTDCERALLRLLEAGVTVNIAHIAHLAHVSDRHARRCLTNQVYELSELVAKLRTPGHPTRIIIKTRKDIV